MVGFEGPGAAFGSSMWQPAPSIASTPVGGIGGTPVVWSGGAASLNIGTPAAHGSDWQALSNGRALSSSSPPAGHNSTPTASASPGTSAEGSTTLVVTGCVDQKMGDTIRGTFQQVSQNHGKPVFKRIDAPPGMSTTVLIYFWDSRDGPDMCGWWFGPEVGGDQVWAFNGNRAPTPPGSGWRIPFDGDIDATMRLRLLTPEMQLEMSSIGVPEIGEEPPHKRLRLPPAPPPPVHAEKADNWRWQAWDAPPAVPPQAPVQHQQPVHRPEEDLEAIEERRRKDLEEMEERRRKKVAEDAAEAVRRAITPMLTVTPETLEQLSTDLNRAQAENWDKLGPHQQQVGNEISAARLQAQERLLKIQAERAEAERIRREEDARLAGLVREASEQAAHAESQAKDMLGKATDLKELERLSTAGEALAMARSLAQAHAAAQKVLDATLSGLDGTTLALEAELVNFPPSSPSRSAYAEARTKLDGLHTQSKSLRNSVEELSDFVLEVYERSSRRAVAERRESKLHDLFLRYDLDGDKRLNRAELLALAREEYDLNLSEVFLSRATRLLSRGGGVPLDNFRRLRQMLGVEFSEVRMREAIAAEQERERQEQEEADRQRRDIAHRKQRAQSLLDEASEFLSEAVVDLPKAEEAAKPLLAEERLGSDALQGVLAATNAALAPLGVALPGARSKLKEAIKILGEDLRELFVSEMIRIEERLRREEERDENIREAAAAGRERLTRRKEEEEKSAKNRKALAKLEKSFADPDESSDGDFDF